MIASESEIIYFAKKLRSRYLLGTSTCCIDPFPAPPLSSSNPSPTAILPLFNFLIALALLTILHCAFLPNGTFPPKPSSSSTHSPHKQIVNTLQRLSCSLWIKRPHNNRISHIQYCKNDIRLIPNVFQSRRRDFDDLKVSKKIRGCGKRGTFGTGFERKNLRQVDPDCCHPDSGEACFEGEDKDYGCDAGGGGVYGDANCF